MRRIPAFVLAIALGNLLVPLNSTMIVVALPLIADVGAPQVTTLFAVLALSGLAAAVVATQLPARIAHPAEIGAGLAPDAGILGDP